VPEKSLQKTSGLQLNMELITRVINESHGLISHGSFLMPVTTNNQQDILSHRQMME
jgi:hypothetical protein